MLSLQQSATASSGGPNFLSVLKKRVAHIDSAPGPRKKPRYFEAETQVALNSGSDTDSDDEGEDLAEPFDPHTFYS